MRVNTNREKQNADVMAVPQNLPSQQPSSRSWNGRWGNDGPYWELYSGDACKVLQTLPRDHFACVITSPPYFWQRDYAVAGQLGLESSIHGYVQSLCDSMDRVRAVLHPKGVLFLNLGDTYYSAKGRPQGHDNKHSGRRFKMLRAVDTSGLGVPKKTLLGMPWRVAIEMISRGWILRAPIVWRRKNAVPEPNVRDRPWRTYEFVFQFAKSPAYSFSRGRLKSDGVEDVWTIESQSKAGRKHPAVFPSDLVRRCLALGNPTAGPVLDPFAGSGTVLRAALDCGMNATGIELNLNFCKATAKNLQTP